MNIKKILFLSSIIFLVSGCTMANDSSNSVNGSSSTNSISESNDSSSNTNLSSTTSNSSNKTTVPAHTLSDSNPPINEHTPGQQVSESTWNSFKNGSSSKFINNYNFTYKAYSGGALQMQYFTKNGYYIQSSSGRLYYERKSGSTFYQYIDVSDGWLRQETTLDIQSKYTSIFVNELYVHMFDYSLYTYDDDMECYTYITSGFGSTIKFQGGYLSYLMYGNGVNVFEIYASFETTIDIPKSYYIN